MTKEGKENENENWKHFKVILKNKSYENYFHFLKIENENLLNMFSIFIFQQK